MAHYCDDCGCKMYDGVCSNCHEEVVIRQQYIDLDIPVPDNIAKTAEEQEIEIARKRIIKETI